MPHHWIHSDGWYNEDKTQFTWAKLVCTVEVVKTSRAHRERESLGGGWYGSATEVVHYIEERKFAYHNGYLIGEIIEFGPFQHPLHKWIKMSRTK